MKIIIDIPGYPAGLAALRSLGIEAICLDCPDAFDGESPSRDLDLALVGDAEGLICSYPPTNLAEMRALRWIQVASVGFTQLVGLGLAERGIRSTNARGCLDLPIAEWNLAMMVNLARNLRQMIRNQDAAVWDRAAVFQSEVRGLTVGFWGYGGIGRETARLARHHGMRVHVLTRNGLRSRQDMFSVPGTGDPEGVLPHRAFSTGEELEFLRTLDFLIISMPLSRATVGLVGERELQALPRTAFLLNPARGPIVQEAALVRALGEGWIAGAALDTHYQYPLPPEHPLWRFPNVILTPHISGSNLSTHYNDRLWALVAENAGRLAEGRQLLNEITAAELAGD